jgi:RHS repeat-associated protein
MSHQTKKIFRGLTTFLMMIYSLTSTSLLGQDQEAWINNWGRVVVADSVLQNNATTSGKMVKTGFPETRKMKFSCGASNDLFKGGFSIRNNPYKYSIYYQDTESEMCYCLARYYSPQLMRFINRDTYDVSNRYAYCNGNPVMNIDPNGHCPIRGNKVAFWGMMILAGLTTAEIVVGAVGAATQQPVMLLAGFIGAISTAFVMTFFIAAYAITAHDASRNRLYNQVGTYNEDENIGDKLKLTSTNDSCDVSYYGCSIHFEGRAAVHARRVYDEYIANAAARGLYPSFTGFMQCALKDESFQSYVGNGQRQSKDSVNFRLACQKKVEVNGTWTWIWRGLTVGSASLPSELVGKIHNQLCPDMIPHGSGASTSGSHLEKNERTRLLNEGV